MRLAWLTDLHLNFLDDAVLDNFIELLAGTDADGFLIGGDTAEATDIEPHLSRLAERVTRPIYFVLGNHDYYQGSVATVRETASQVAARISDLHWLPERGVVELTAKSALLGHGGWGDGRLGDYANSRVLLNDYLLISDLAGLSPERRLTALNELGDQAAARVRELIVPAVAEFSNLIFLTHAPPFRQACWYNGHISNDQWLPHFTCKAVGDVLFEVMEQNPAVMLTVLCGHTHGEGHAEILPNLVVDTGPAVYGAPRIQTIVEVP
jgi:Icc protein